MERSPVPSGAGAQSRYVVLRHTGYGSDHFDLMIEPAPGAERLLTWRSAAWPLADGAALTALGSHRRAYLEYEGPVSGGRGTVSRVAEGRCHVEQAEDGWLVEFDGGDAWRLGDIARRMSRYDPASHDRP